MSCQPSTRTAYPALGPACISEQCLAVSQGAGPGHLETIGGQLRHRGLGQEVQLKDQPQGIARGLDPGQGLSHLEEKGQEAMTDLSRKAAILVHQCRTGGVTMGTEKNQNLTSVLGYLV